jgi:hypothetical protein
MQGDKTKRDEEEAVPRGAPAPRIYENLPKR